MKSGGGMETAISAEDGDIEDSAETSVDAVGDEERAMQSAPGDKVPGSAVP